MSISWRITCTYYVLEQWTFRSFFINLLYFAHRMNSKKYFTFCLWDWALAWRIFARLSKCSFLASPSFLWLRIRNSSSCKRSFSAEKDKEKIVLKSWPIKSSSEKTTLCSLYHWKVPKFFLKDMKTFPKHALQIGFINQFFK